LRSKLFTLGALVVLIGVTAAAATAAKPGPGTSTGIGSVFVSNPVEDLGIQSLRDQKDSDAAVPAAAYHDVTLTNLDGSGFLRGDWATIVSETGNPAYSPTNTFRYTRSQDEFEQVMGYFWITESQKYIQSLGFGVRGSGLRAVNMEPQRLRINQWGLDNSFATTHKDEIRLGKGGVDDAEDGEMITHEYGHAIHFEQREQLRCPGQWDAAAVYEEVLLAAAAAPVDFACTWLESAIARDHSISPDRQGLVADHGPGGVMEEHASGPLDAGGDLPQAVAAAGVSDAAKRSLRDLLELPADDRALRPVVLDQVVHGRPRLPR
jgi:hypothetical protein